MWTRHKNAKSQRTQVYVDCICGVVCSLSAIIGILFFSQPDVSGHYSMYEYLFTGGIIFWIGYLILSLFIVGLGIFAHIQEKKSKPDEMSKEKLKAPIV
jgi:predicted transporter